MIRAHEFRRFQLELQLHDGSCTAVMRKKRTPVTVTRLVQWACLLLLPLWNLLQRASLAVLCAASLPLVCCAAYEAFGSVREERVSVHAHMGASIHAVSWYGAETCRFIEWQHLGEPLINEHVTTSSVVFYLALLDKDKEELATVFGSLQPSLEVLRVVFAELLSVLGAEG